MQTETGSGSVGETTTGNSTDDDEFCAGFLDRKSCFAADLAGPAGCIWDTIYIVSMDGGQCEVTDRTELCLATAQEGTDPGCAPPPGCDTVPFYRAAGDRVETIQTCGSSLPNGFEPCTFVEEGVFEPAECVCLCEALDTGSSSGDSSGGGATGSSSSG